MSNTRYTQWAWLSLALITLTQLTLPLVADEAYYTWWASRPRLGYLDHPPAVMAWAWVGEHLLWGPRALNLLSLPLLGFLAADLSRALHLRGAHLIAPVALLTPLGFALGVLVTPDAPLTLGWLLALWGWGRGRWISSAMGLSLALWAKPTALLAALALCGAWVVRERDSEGEGGEQGLRDALKVAALTSLLYSPHLIWSLTHGGAPWTFQAGRAWGRFGLFEWIASQAWVMSPLWAWWGVKVAVEITRSSHALDPQGRARRLLALLGLSQLAPWVIVSLVMRVEANWSALAWPPLLLLALDELADQAHKVRLACRLGAALTLPLALSPMLSALLPLSVGPPRDPERVGRAVEACLSALPSQQVRVQGRTQGLSVVAGRYQEAALLWRAGLPFHYLNALKRRQSEFVNAPELHFTPTQHSSQQCGFLYLGSEPWLGERCEGVREALSGERCELPDGIEATLCRCTP